MNKNNKTNFQLILQIILLVLLAMIIGFNLYTKTLSFPLYISISAIAIIQTANVIVHEWFE